MKGKIRTVSVFLFLCTLSAVFCAALGDVNNSSSVDIVDALMIAQYYVGLNPPGFTSGTADVNCDGSITIVDALMVAQYYVGLISSFPCSTATPTRTATAAPTRTSTTTALSALTVYIAGDSTVQTYVGSTIKQAGWGQMLPEYVKTQATISNQAIGGRTARRFIEEGRLDTIMNAIKPGDWFLVQFGTNDGNTTATYTLNGVTIPYYLNPQTDFKTYLTQYVDRTRAKGANIIFVTPPPRNSAYCTGGNGTGAHAQAMRELGSALNVPVADLNQKTVDYLKAICPSPTPENFFLLKADGTVDGTHFQENGARIMAGFIAAGIKTLNLGLAAYLK